MSSEAMQTDSQIESQFSRERGDDDYVQEEEATQDSTENVALVMRLMLSAAQTDIPLDVSEINQVLPGKRVKKEVRDEVIAEAKKSFEEIFGFEMVDISDPSSALDAFGQSAEVAQANPKKGKSKSKYTLRSKFKASETKSFVLEDKSPDVKIILLAILSIIKLSDGKVMKDDLWNFLKRLGIHTEGKISGLSSRKLVEKDFVRQMYLSKVKDDSGKDVFSAGVRAMTEISKVDIERFINDVMKDSISGLPSN